MGGRPGLAGGRLGGQQGPGCEGGTFCFQTEAAEQQGAALLTRGTCDHIAASEDAAPVWVLGYMVQVGVCREGDPRGPRPPCWMSVWSGFGLRDVPWARGSLFPSVAWGSARKVQRVFYDKARRLHLPPASVNMTPDPRSRWCGGFGGRLAGPRGLNEPHESLVLQSLRDGSPPAGSAPCGAGCTCPRPRGQRL